MAKENIFTGTTPNDGTGDTLRVAFTKVNNNFTELYTQYSNVSKSVSNTWVSPQTSNTYTLVQITGASRVALPAANVSLLNTYSTRTGTSSEIYVPKNANTDAVLQPIWDDEVDEASFLITIRGNTSEGFISTYDADEWRLQYDDGPVTYSTDDDVDIQVVYVPTPQPWFDPDALGIQDFRGAMVKYHAYIDNSFGYNKIGEVVYPAGDGYFDADDRAVNSRYQTQDVSLSVRLGTDKLHYRNASTPAGNLHIQWTADIWTGQDKSHADDI